MSVHLIQPQFDHKMQRVLNSGVEIMTITDLKQAHPDDWQKLYYELENALRQDVPSPDEYVPEAFDIFAKNVFNHPTFMPDTHFIARDKGQYVGLSCFWKDLNNADRLRTGLTGVVRSHRRRGIATALKIHAIQICQKIRRKGHQNR